MRSTRRAIGALVAVLGLILSLLSFSATAAGADAPSECGSTFQGSADAQLSISSTPAGGSVVQAGDNIQVDLAWPTNAWSSISKVLVCVQIDGVDSDLLFFEETPGVNDGAAAYSFAVPEDAGEVCVVGRVSGTPTELNESDDTHKSNTLCWDVDEPDEDDPSISISKTPVSTQVASGSSIGYAIVVTAGGTGTSEDVTVGDNLDAGYSWSEDHEDCSIAANVLFCDFGDMASGATETVNLTAPTTAGVCDTVDNTATVEASNIEGSPDGTDSTGNVITITGCGGFTPPPPGPQPNLSATLECGTGGMSVTVRNTGDASGVVDVLSDDEVVENDLTVAPGQEETVLVAVDEDTAFDIDVTGVQSFAGVRDCEEVEGEVITPPAPTPMPPAAAPEEEVKGVVVARTLPRTGNNTLPLAEVGLGLLILGVGLTLTSRRQMRVL